MGRRLGCPSPRTPSPLSAFRASSCDPLGLSNRVVLSPYMHNKNPVYVHERRTWKQMRRKVVRGSENVLPQIFVNPFRRLRTRLFYLHIFLFLQFLHRWIGNTELYMFSALPTTGKCTMCNLFKYLKYATVIYFIFKMFYLQGKRDRHRNSKFASIRLFYFHSSATSVRISLFYLHAYRWR